MCTNTNTNLNHYDSIFLSFCILRARLHAAHCAHCCDTIARLLGNIRPLDSTSLWICHRPYNNIVQRPTSTAPLASSSSPLRPPRHSILARCRAGLTQLIKLGPLPALEHRTSSKSLLYRPTTIVIQAAMSTTSLHLCPLPRLGRPQLVKLGPLPALERLDVALGRVRRPERRRLGIRKRVACLLSRRLLQPARRRLGGKG